MLSAVLNETGGNGLKAGHKVSSVRRNLVISSHFVALLSRFDNVFGEIGPAEIVVFLVDFFKLSATIASDQLPEIESIAWNPFENANTRECR